MGLGYTQNCSSATVFFFCKTNCPHFELVIRQRRALNHSLLWDCNRFVFSKSNRSLVIRQRLPLHEELCAPIANLEECGLHLEDFWMAKPLVPLTLTNIMALTV